MKARIEKKLSKRLTEIAPLLFCGWWVCEETSRLAYRQRSSVSHVPSVGHCYDCDTLWARWLGDWPWYCYHYSVTEVYSQTGFGLLRLAAKINAKKSAELCAGEC